MSIKRFTIIASVYGVEKYLNDFFISVVNQTISFERHIELIVIDDGSTDNSKEIVRRWQQQYPHNIKYVYKENGGLSSARNEGLKYVTSNWVSFIDPDDFISENYFEKVDLFLLNNIEEDIGLISCNYIYYLEAEDRVSDTHPLSFRFKNDETVVTAPDLDGLFQISANSVFFRVDIINENNLRMDEKVIPNFEDGHFSARYLLSIKGKKVAFLKSPKYYYRRRQDETSLMDTSWTKVEQFKDKLIFGHLDLLGVATRKEGEVPTFIQRMVLYDLIWYVKVIVNKEEQFSFLGKKEKNKFLLLLKEIFEYIDKETIGHFNIGGCWFYHKVGILGLFKEDKFTFQITYIDDVDIRDGIVKLRYFYHGDLASELILLDGKEVKPTYSKTQIHRLFGEAFVNERFLWFPLVNDSTTLTFKIGNMDSTLSINGKQYLDGVPSHAITAHFKLKPLKESIFPFSVILLRQLSNSPVVKKLYDKSWVFMDRDTQADDNGEHLYRYVSNNYPNVNVFFVLRKTSHDWQRLADENFKLIEFDSQEHKLALLNAEHLISSHIDQYVTDLMPKKWFGDLLRYSFTFLQHGITKDDISNWLNSKSIDTLVTATQAEFSSIVGDDTSYKFSAKEVILSGFPRHDELLEINQQIETEKLILIMPTWRQGLAGSVKGLGNDRYSSDVFFSSDFARLWKNFLHSSELKTLVEHHGYQVIFFPHINVQQHSDWFDAPDYISVLSHIDQIAMQSLFGRAQLLITDYSSVAFEMAYLNKPVLYYQFDIDFVYGDGHLTGKGYYDYFEDGFGPVCTNESELINELSTILNNNGLPSEMYADRIKSLFAYRDGKCCQRVFERLQKFDNYSQLDC